MGIDKGDKVLVLGLSKSGIAAAKLAKKHGADVYLTEGKKEVNNDSVTELENLGIHVEFGAHSDKFIKGSKLVITSPGIPPHSEIMQRIKKKIYR